MRYFILIVCLLVVFWLTLDTTCTQKTINKVISGVLALLFACLATYIAGWLL